MKIDGFSKITLIFALTVVACSDNTVAPTNTPPVISSLVADSTLLTVKSQTKVECIAHDPDNDDLHYEWLSYPGSVNGEGSVIYWQAPEFGGTYPLICLVTDEFGDKVEARITFSVFGNASPIYQVILDELQNSRYPSNQIIIVDSTIYDQTSTFAFGSNKKLLFERGKGVLFSTYENYEETNQTPIRLQDYPFWNKDYTLLSIEELYSLFGDEPYWMANCDGWETFFTAYPNAINLLLLSKIGFNYERNQALVYMEELFKKYGHSYFFILSKNDEWEITSVVGLVHVDYLCG